MRSKRFLHKVLVFLSLAATISVLAACRDEEQLEELELTLEAEVRPTEQPEPSPTAPEAPTEEPTEEALPDVEPVPSEVPATAEAAMEEFVSATEFFSVKIPAGWSTEEVFPGGAFIMANSEAALERYNSGRAVESGDLILNIGFLPYMLLQQRELKPLNIQFEATPDVFLQSLLPMFRITDDAIFSDVELVSLSDERDAGLLTVSDEGREGMILMFVAGDGVIALVSTVGFPDEMGEFQETTYTVAAEVAFSGAQDALYGTLLGG